MNNVVEIRVVLFKQQKLLFKQHNQTSLILRIHGCFLVVGLLDYLITLFSCGKIDRVLITRFKSSTILIITPPWRS